MPDGVEAMNAEAERDPSLDLHVFEVTAETRLSDHEGYLWVEVPNWLWRSSRVLSCRRCGAVVLQVDAHNDWHEGQA